MNEPDPNDHKEKPENGDGKPDQKNLVHNMSAAPSDQTTAAPETATADQNNPPARSKILEAVLYCLRHYWDAPREKAKWTDTATVMLTLLIAAAALYSAWVFNRQLNVIQGQLEITDRPWITIEAVANTEWIPNALIGGPLIFDAAGRGSITVKFILKNIGHSVATHVYVRQEAIATGIDAAVLLAPLDEQKRICDGPNPYTKGTLRADERYTVFPSDSQIEFSKSDFDTKSIANTIPGLKNGKPIFLYVLGCIDYEYANSLTSHQTGFIFQVYGDGAHKGIQTLDTIPVNLLTFEPFTFGGKYAY